MSKIRFSLLSLMVIFSSSCNGQDTNVAGNIPEIEVKWVEKISTENANIRFQDDALLFNKSKKLSSYNLNTRRIDWVSETGGSRFFTKNNEIYLLSNDGKINIIDDSNGNVKNTFEVPEPFNGVNGGWNGTDDRTYLLRGYDTLSVLDTKSIPKYGDKNELWRKSFYTIESYTFDSENNVYISASEARDIPKNKVYAYNPDGTQKWVIDLSEGEAVARGGNSKQQAEILQVVDNTLIALASGGAVIAYDLTTQKPKWERWDNFNTCPVGRASSAAFMLVRDGKIFVSPDGGTCLLAFDFQTGKKLWTFASPNQVTFASPMTYVNGVLYATNTYLWALEGISGKVLGVSANFLEGTSGRRVHYDAKRNQLLLWGDELTSFKPVR